MHLSPRFNSSPRFRWENRDPSILRASSSISRWPDLAIGLILASVRPDRIGLWPPLVAGVLDVVLLAAITGALHLDGLADAADGLYGHREREKALAIMKDSRVGAMGLVVVACVLLVKAAGLGSVDQGRFLALMIVPAYARSAMIFGMRFLPYARGKEGTGSPFFETPLSMWI
jgi:adenosylcobinamide-GDP ribazoletransferase